MAKSVFSIDGVDYDNVIVTSLKRSFSILDTKNSGRTVADGLMHRDIIGTYYNYEIAIQFQDKDRATYDSLYEVLSAPVDYHRIVVPYAQSKISFNAYITGGEDTIEHMAMTNNGSVEYINWSGLTLKFVRMGAYRLP